MGLQIWNSGALSASIETGLFHRTDGPGTVGSPGSRSGGDLVLFGADHGEQLPRALRLQQRAAELRAGEELGDPGEHAQVLAVLLARRDQADDGARRLPVDRVEV